MLPVHVLNLRDQISLPIMNFSPRAFSLRQLQYIVAVADLLSFNRAADECRVSQPSLSLQTAELERALACFEQCEADVSDVI